MNEISPSGILLLYKESGPTSHDCVGAVRRLYGTKQVGHTGTLDPLASGLLVIMTGRAAKAAEYISCDRKSYEAEITLGLKSDTEDITGTLEKVGAVLPRKDAFLSAVASLHGKSMQIPPMYSALKIGGRKLCDLARKGVTVEREAREIEIFDISAQPLCDGERPDRYRLSLTVSAGTYVRTICANLGASLGCGAVMSSLCRTAAGGFSLDGAHRICEIEAADRDTRLSWLLPAESLFYSLPPVTLPPFFAGLARNGCEIYESKIGLEYETGSRVKLYDDNGFFALGEVMDFEDGRAIKPIKLFRID